MNAKYRVLLKPRFKKGSNRGVFYVDATKTQNDICNSYSSKQMAKNSIASDSTGMKSVFNSTFLNSIFG